MPGEEENGRDDMIIDQPQSDFMRINALPDEFNPNYLKLYYGNSSSSPFNSHYFITHCAILPDISFVMQVFVPRANGLTLNCLLLFRLDLALNRIELIG